MNIEKDYLDLKDKHESLMTDLTENNYTVISKNLTETDFEIVATGNGVISVIVDLIKEFPNSEQILAQVKTNLEAINKP